MQAGLRCRWPPIGQQRSTEIVRLAVNRLPKRVDMNRAGPKCLAKRAVRRPVSPDAQTMDKVSVPMPPQRHAHVGNTAEAWHMYTDAAGHSVDNVPMGVSGCALTCQVQEESRRNG